MLENLEKFMQELKDFDARDELAVIVENNLDLIADLQRDQWMEGRGVDGQYLRPFYSENPYFKTKEAAERYANWKQKITPNPQRPKDVPNLYINGFLHSTVYAEIYGKDTLDPQFIIDGDADFADRAFEVHKNAIGLNEEKRLLFAENITLTEFAKILKEKTGLEI